MKITCLRPVILVLLIALAGCETLAPRVEGEDREAFDARRSELLGMPGWGLEGRVAIRAGDEGQSANLAWNQEGEFFDIRLHGPFGAGNTHIIGTADELLLETSDGEQLHTRSPEADLYWRLGWTLPLDRMPYWILGLPGPGSLDRLEVDGAGRLQSLRQGSWQLDIPQYLERDDGRIMPRKLTLERDDVRIRLVIDEWQLPPQAVDEE
jgi:outer membrane lipoprotein LolB